MGGGQGRQGSGGQTPGLGTASPCISSPWWAGGLGAETGGPQALGAGGGAGEGHGRAGLLRLGVIVGAPSLLELALDKILLQLLPVADHKLFCEILQEQ